ncbi:MAG: nucleoside phosphorylase [Chloroflexi bacterium]|nr:nucleoside phosphorylase [Chloroflexota bacterium]MCL5274682.1 nucleoside phosphorylase [Chloroflexota bacterium]
MPEAHIDYDESSVFTPENLLREARRQKHIPPGEIPNVCVLDPDGDIVRHLVAHGKASRNQYWACYHTDLYDFTHDGIRFGIVGCAVGASFAVLVAEEMFASGCQLLISITSAGQIAPIRNPPYFILIEKALRDEGTSRHYLPPAEYSHLQGVLRDLLSAAPLPTPIPLDIGVTWTTDAPFRETPGAIARCRDAGIHAVEMEAAALYAFAQARRKPVICLAHVTNQMAVEAGDFEKGDDNGSHAALALLGAIAQLWLKKTEKQK